MNIISLQPVVAVPARNEEERLPTLIEAIENQTIHVGRSRPIPLIVVLNNCSDRSAEVCRQAAALCPNVSLTLIDVELPAALAHAGQARHIAMEAAAAVAGPDGVILTTDADATPDRDWIAQSLKAIEAGADIVGGRLIGDPREEAALGPAVLKRAQAVCLYQDRCDELASVIDPLAYDPWPRHHDHTGASLAVRADVYRRLGGLDPLRSREDLAFVSKARAEGFKLRHAPAVRVVVSARLDGRAAGGMADCLKAWRRDEAAGAPLLVENPDAIEERLWRRASIRALDGAARETVRDGLNRIGLAAQDLGVSALIEQCAGDDPDAPADTPVFDAIDAVAARLAALRGERDAA